MRAVAEEIPEKINTEIQLILCSSVTVGVMTSLCKGIINNWVTSRHLNVNERQIKDLHRKSLLFL